MCHPADASTCKDRNSALIIAGASFSRQVPAIKANPSKGGGAKPTGLLLSVCVDEVREALRWRVNFEACDGKSHRRSHRSGCPRVTGWKWAGGTSSSLGAPTALR